MTDAEQIKGTIRKLREQAEDGHAESMFLLAVAHAQGKGVERNDTAAARWFLQAARKGHLRATTSIGYLYATGRGVKHDLVLGFIFLSRAARGGPARGRPADQGPQGDEPGPAQGGRATRPGGLLMPPGQASVRH